MRGDGLRQGRRGRAGQPPHRRAIVAAHGGEAGPGGLRLPRGARRVARQNHVLALVYNALMLPAAAFGLLGPALVAAAMLASSVSVVLYNQRLNVALEGERAQPVSLSRRTSCLPTRQNRKT